MQPRQPLDLRADPWQLTLRPDLGSRIGGLWRNGTAVLRHGHAHMRMAAAAPT